MENYRDYTPELKTTTIFQGLEDEALLDLLKAMGPPIVRLKAGERLSLPEKGQFFIVLKSSPGREIEPRRFKYAMPKFGEPGMMMAEIPGLSLFMEALAKKPTPPFEPKPLESDLDCLRLTGDMAVKFYDQKVAPAQSVFLRNFLGILAQKVMDVRRELFLLKDGRDIFNL
ncbi:MAG: hypothetical protein LBI10_07020 [Deltaproteobacteria bacterium]|nr:hypothetical protein [Deltaproteobacteria bacterium]